MKKIFLMLFLMPMVSFAVSTFSATTTVSTGTTGMAVSAVEATALQAEINRLRAENAELERTIKTMEEELAKSEKKKKTLAVLTGVGVAGTIGFGALALVQHKQTKKLETIHTCLTTPACLAKIKAADKTAGSKSLVLCMGLNVSSSKDDINKCVEAIKKVS